MIPQVRLELGLEEQAAVAEVVASGWLTEGPACEEFKARLLKLIGAPYGVFAPNGTIALALALMARGIKGRTVIVPNLTMAASAFAVILAGGRPVFCDVEPDTLQLDWDRAISMVQMNPRIAAIMPVHLFGNAARIRFATVDVIEDACQAIGVRAYGKHVGQDGVACFSFFADKTITTGEGGFVVCQDEEFYKRLCYLRNQGRSSSGSFVHPFIGYNFRITDIQAAIGVVQLGRLQHNILAKLEWLERYAAAFNDLPQITMLKHTTGTDYVPFRCVIFCDQRALLADYLRTNGVEPRAMFSPLHSQPCFRYICNQGDEHFPVSIAAHRRGLMLPLRVSLTDEEFERIVKTVRSFYGR